MEISNPNNGNGKHEREVIAGIKIIESEYRIQKPIFEDVKVDRPVYVDKPIEIPTGIRDMVTELARVIAQEITGKLIDQIDSRLEAAIKDRVKEIEVPKITYKEELNVITKDIHVINAVIEDRHVINAYITDKEVINPILIDKKIINPIFEDVEIERPIYKDRIVIAPKFEEVVVAKPRFVEKEIVVIHPKYIDMKGNPEPC